MQKDLMERKILLSDLTTQDLQNDADGIIIPEPSPEEISPASQERIDFCLSKCGEGYCRAMTPRRQLGDYPCIEYICTFCKNKNDPIAACKFCRGNTLQEVKKPVVDVNDLPEDRKPGCFGAIGLNGKNHHLLDCENGKGCLWMPRCRQSQVDY